MGMREITETKSTTHSRELPDQAAALVFADPIAYLQDLGIEAELVSWPVELPEAA